MNNTDGFSFTVRKRQRKKDSYTLFYIHMVSQKWLSENEVDRPFWEHIIRIIIPHNIQASTALLLVRGENNDSYEDVMHTVPSYLIETACDTRSIISEVFMIPNQPLRFRDELKEPYITHGRVEDEIIAYSWDKFLLTKDPQWCPRLPMMKAIMRAMDTVQNVVQEDFFPNRNPIEDFVIAGASKRAWAAWITAANDPRVRAIIPISFDISDIKESFSQHYRTYGSWSFPLHSYIDIRLPERWDSQAFQELMAIEGPYQLKDRIAIPKFFIVSTGDEIFPPGNLSSYIHSLPGKTSLLVISNSGHRIDESRYWPALSAYYSCIIQPDERLPPTISWKIEKGKITLRSSQTPKDVLFWTAMSPYNHDFRHHTVGDAWHSTRVLPLENGGYQAFLPKSSQGTHYAGYLQCSFRLDNKMTYLCSTELFYS